MLERLRTRADAMRRDVYALYLASRHPRAGRRSKLIIAGIVAYLLSPVDLIPDFIPVLGALDDLLLVPLGAALAVKTIPPDVWRECRERAAKEFDRSLPRNRKAGAVVVAIWIAILAAAGFAAWRAFF